MNLSAVFTIASQETRINIRNRWTLLFAGVFGLLALAISYFGMVTEGYAGFQGFERTTASLLSLVLYLVPLVALTMATLSLTGDRGAIELLFSQPVARHEILIGKVAGLFGSMLTAMLFGFGVAGTVIAVTGRNRGTAPLPILRGRCLVAGPGVLVPGLAPGRSWRHPRTGLRAGAVRLVLPGALL